MSLLEIRDVHAYYGDSHVLQGVNLKIEKGQAVAILGISERTLRYKLNQYRNEAGASEDLDE